MTVETQTEFFPSIAAPRAALSTLAGGHGEHRLAYGVVGLSLLVFLLLVPFAKLPLARIEAFIPAYEAALALSDLITVVLLFGQFVMVRSRGLLLLAGAYLFTCLIVVPHALTFPGLFAPTGLLGATPQSTAWLYMFWHGLFPVALILYVRDGHVAAASGEARFPVLGPALAMIGSAVALVVALAWLATAGSGLLPAILDGTAYLSAYRIVVTLVWFTSLAALLALWWRRPHSVLDLWLMVVMCAWLCDIALSAMLNAGRFDLGFYAGRAYGFVAASFVLIMLLIRSLRLSLELSRSLEAETLVNVELEQTVRERTRALATTQEELFHATRVSTMSELASAIAHELNQPLTAISTYLQAAQRLAGGLDSDASGRLVEIIGKSAEQAVRAGQIVHRMRKLIERGETERRPEDIGAVVLEAAGLALLGRSGVELETDLVANLPSVVIDRIQIQQVVVNLIRNAIDAVGERGCVLRLRTSQAGAEAVAVEVCDNGPGLPAAVREQLFQPFVTTKRSGMGLGLSICRSIVNAHGGSLSAGDNPGGGTCFRFELPVTTDRQAEPD